MSRSERRRAKQNVKNFTPNKKNALNKGVSVIIGSIAVVFFVGTMLIQRGA